MKNYKLKLALFTIIQYCGAIALGWYFSHLLEIIIIIPLFFWFRSKYTKSLHAKTMCQCTIYTLCMFFIIVLLAQPIAISIFLTIILCYVTTEVLYYVRDYMDFLKVKKFQIYRGMSKEILENKCKMYNLTEVETSIMIHFYCDKLKLFQIANILNYSEIRVSQIKKEVLNKFNQEL